LGEKGRDKREREREPGDVTELLVNHNKTFANEELFLLDEYKKCALR
jgi:hypothetical protein